MPSLQMLYRQESRVLRGTTWTARGHGSMGSISIATSKCLPLYTFYCTTPFKDRLSMLRVLLGGADPLFHFNALVPPLANSPPLVLNW
jgi:hypothetical protein